MNTFIELNLVLQVAFYTIVICDEFDCDNFEINAMARQTNETIFVSRGDKYWYQHENIDTVKTAIIQNTSQLIKDFKRIDIVLYLPVIDSALCPQRSMIDGFYLYERSSCLWRYTWNGWDIIIITNATLWKFQEIVTNELFRREIVQCQDLISMAFQPKVRNVFGLAGHRIFVTTCFDRRVVRPTRSSWEDFANRPISEVYDIYDYVGNWKNISTMYYNESVDSFVIINKKGDMFVCPVEDAAERIRSNSTFVNKLPCKPWHRVAYYLGFCNGTMPLFISTSTTIKTTTQATIAQHSTIEIESSTKISNSMGTFAEDVSTTEQPISTIEGKLSSILLIFLFGALFVGLLLIAFFIWKFMFGKSKEEPLRIGKEWSTMDSDTWQTLSISSESTESSFSAKDESKNLIKS